MFTIKRRNTKRHNCHTRKLNGGGSIYPQIEKDRRNAQSIRDKERFTLNNTIKKKTAEAAATIATAEEEEEDPAVFKKYVEDPAVVAKRDEERVQALSENKKMGPAWRPILQDLLERKKISEEEYRLYTKNHEVNKIAQAEVCKKNMETLENNIAACVCKDCGEVLNAGTYAMIYQSNKDDDLVIKGNINDQSKSDNGCDGVFEKEFHMYNKIKSKLPKLKTISLVDIKRHWVEDRRCYLEMDRIKPVVLSTEQLAECEKMSKYQEQNRLFIDKLVKQDTLFMLLPKREYTTLESGGNKYSKWYEIADFGISLYLKILGIRKIQYYQELKMILRDLMSNNIGLKDVEFILGSVKGKNGIFMIDLDKVEFKDTKFNITEQATLTSQDMFPYKNMEDIVKYDKHLERGIFGTVIAHDHNTRYQSRRIGGIRTMKEKRGGTRKKYCSRRNDR